MNITNFRRVRINDNSNWADIRTMENRHSSDVFMVSAYEYNSHEKYSKRMIKVLRKNREVCMFVSMFHDIELPDFWKDAEVLYEWTESEESE